ncbi:hypothetical protein [Alteromonas sp. KUL49]|uniref:hypothetical protein n=1 Tax=Alteromonas sp. KUL49 TaxID=2480798 RepID=UPI0010FFAF3B|nr:hypothetical protein [Alteromonas sp. KUL49]GEA11988.1 hypothetical protein KUL49_23630 [Alteromonas sp. KUL49]
MESALALASVFELSPKDLEISQHVANNASQSESIAPNWSGLLGMCVLAICAYLIIDLTAKYPSWERISAVMVFGLLMVFSLVSYGARNTLLFSKRPTGS